MTARYREILNGPGRRLIIYFRYAPVMMKISVTNYSYAIVCGRLLPYNFLEGYNFGLGVIFIRRPVRRILFCLVAPGYPAFAGASGK